MARARLDVAPGADRDEICARIAGIDGVRSVDVRDDAIEVEYDDTIVGENRLIEEARVKGVPGAASGIAADRAKG
jgi:copper chaperone CopZ